MTNWASKFLDEHTDIASKLSKRASHALHFNMGSAGNVGYFTSAPSHYLDNGIYKPIDTALVAVGNGWYGAPHSKIKIHTDGRVGIDGSDYQQYVPLPNTPVGYVDGDKIVREFSFGVHNLYMFADKFKQEIVLYREPTKAEIQSFIADEAGTLPLGEFRKQDIQYYEQGSSEINTFTNLFTLRKWLASATYPVVIDPDITATGGASYYSVYGSATSWSTAYSTSYAATSALQVGGGRGSSTSYRVYRGYLKFDTSSLGAGATVTSANVSLAALNITLCEANNNCYMYKYDWTAIDPLSGTNRETAFDNIRSSAQDGLWYNMDACSLDTYYQSAALDTTWINKAGSTYYGMRGIADINNSSPASGTTHYGILHNPDEDYPPYMTIVYTAGPAKIKTVNGIAIASLKTINSILQANTKSVNGIA